MQPTLSVIIPTKNNARSLPHLFASLQKQTYQNFETIVVDNNSTDATKEIAVSTGSVVDNWGPERSAQRNRGAEIARANILLFVDSDMELTKYVLEKCILGMDASDALCLRESIVTGDNYWAKARAFERDSYFRSLYYEAARCLRKDVFNDIGGYDTTMTGIEDMALQAKLIESDYRIGWVDDVVLHHEEEVGFRQYLTKRRNYGRTDKQFQRKFPEHWSRLQSPLLRSKVLLKHYTGSNNLSSLLYAPAILIMRGAEFIKRRQ